MRFRCIYIVLLCAFSRTVSPHTTTISAFSSTLPTQQKSQVNVLLCLKILCIVNESEYTVEKCWGFQIRSCFRHSQTLQTVSVSASKDFPNLYFTSAAIDSAFYNSRLKTSLQAFNIASFTSKSPRQRIQAELHNCLLLWQNQNKIQKNTLFCQSKKQLCRSAFK